MAHQLSLERNATLLITNDTLLKSLDQRLMFLKVLDKFLFILKISKIILAPLMLTEIIMKTPFTEFRNSINTF